MMNKVGIKNNLSEIKQIKDWKYYRRATAAGSESYSIYKEIAADISRKIKYEPVLGNDDVKHKLREFLSKYDWPDRDKGKKA